MDRETLIRAILECNFAGYDSDIIDIAVKRIMENIVDAVEVVRCRDCKQFVQTNAIHDGECSKLQLFVNRDYYCWWGERKENADNYH